MLYDAAGDFDRNFDWWKASGKHCLVEPQLPFENGRSDLLTGSGSRLDIENINLLATLLVHAQYQGYWGQLGMQFQEEMEALLERHLLNGLVDAPWVRTDDPESDDDDRFFAALQELVAYAFEESVRIKKKGRRDTSISRNSAGSPVFVSEVPQRVSEAISPARTRRSSVMRAHQPGSEPIDIPETIPNPVVVPKPTPTPTEPTPKEPVRIPEKVP